MTKVDLTFLVQRQGRAFLKLPYPWQNIILRIATRCSAALTERRH